MLGGVAIIILWQTLWQMLPVPGENYYNAGLAAYQSGQYKLAFTRFQMAARNGHLSSRAEYNSGNAAFESGDYQSAVMAYETALVRVPLDADAWHNLELARKKIPNLPGPGTLQNQGLAARSILSAAQLRARRQLQFMPLQHKAGPTATQQADLFRMSPDQIVDFLREETRANYPFRPSSSLRHQGPEQSDSRDW